MKPNYATRPPSSVGLHAPPILDATQSLGEAMRKSRVTEA